MDSLAEVSTARRTPSALIGPMARVGVRARGVWGLASIAGVCVLFIAARLTPDARGYGTHERITGTWPCGFVLTTGLPCPTCGMTTAFAHMMHGRPVTAFVTQPAGAAMCLATIVMTALGTYIAATGRGPRVDWERLGPVRLMLGLGGLLIGGWGFKIAYGLATGALPVR